MFCISHKSLETGILELLDHMRDATFPNAQSILEWKIHIDVDSLSRVRSKCQCQVQLLHPPPIMLLLWCKDSGLH